MKSDNKQRSLETNLSEWMATGLLLLLCFPTTLSERTYRWRDHQTNESRACQQCPPGTYVAHPCTVEKPTDCKPCPKNYYTEFWNYLDSCLYCNVFCNSLEEEARPCNRTHNRECQCKAGYHAKWDSCKRHSECPLGSGVVALGNPREDTKCASCPPGTFSGAASSTEPCKFHRNCSAQGLQVNVPGNSFHDTFCTTCELGQNSSREDGTGNGDCKEAFIDFVPYEVKSVRRLHRLKRLLTHRPDYGMIMMRRPEELQVELHNYLAHLKSTEGTESVAQRLWRALQRMKHHHVLGKVKKHFPSGYEFGRANRTQV